MTDEERKLVLHYLKYEAETPRLYSNSKDDSEYWEMRVKALQKLADELERPCEDAISRQAVFEIIRDFEYKNSHEEMLINSRIKQLPSVTPAENVGHWEYVQYDGNPNIGNWHCSKCRAIVNYEPTYSWEKKPYHNYCPNCGAKMEES